MSQKKALYVLAQGVEAIRKGDEERIEALKS